MVNGTEVVTGTVGVCRNGVLSGYCDDGAIFDGAAQQFCNVLGYVCKCIYTFYRYNLGVTFLPPFFNSFLCLFLYLFFLLLLFSPLSFLLSFLL